MDERPRVGVIINEGKDLAGAGLEELRAALADVGHADPPWYEVPKSKKAPKKVSKLIEDDGIDRLLVWGGDGTVRRCIDHLLHEGHDGVAIGVLPAGTGNLLAVNLGIPIDLLGAVDVAVHGQPRPIDVGVVNDEQHFAVMAGTGFDALLIRDADDSGMKDKYGRLGYVWAGVKNRNVSPAHMEISVDGDSWFSGDASSVIAGNVGTLIGGIPAFPDASPTDGRLDLGVVTARSATDWARLFGSVLTHRVDGSLFAKVTTAEKVVVDLDRTLPWEADGGDRDRTDHYEIRVLPAAISICQPRRATEEEPA
ncbi:MAG: sphingosine kinase [Acidimicrobiaceae bacterium]|nr:sphingosine kinase [Acidimicrobiaceae bacterium]